MGQSGTVLLSVGAKGSYDLGDRSGLIRDYGAGGVNVITYTINK